MLGPLIILICTYIPFSSASCSPMCRPNEFPKPVQPESWKLIPSCLLTLAELEQDGEHLQR